ncbi:MAG TPA: sigma-54-dependent Fis family transcriptional regulator [Myxococcales bacterium]|nr:sigma-54-dependent Fis family transcriptional regulator [Myxococcales bacterium]
MPEETHSILSLPPSARRSPLVSKNHVLIVDDEDLYRRALERILKRQGHTISCACNGPDALEFLNGHSVDLVLCDIKMPGMNGLDVVKRIHEIRPDLPCIVITGFGSSERSLEALGAGAFWYLEKPFEQERLDVVRRLVDQAIEHGQLKSENRRLKSELHSRHKFDRIIGKSEGLSEMLSLIEKVADTESTVLITGESGTGKELVAQALHYNSRRADKPLVTVNCGAIPEELLESELFGHIKGAFTGAHQSREGRFSRADGGTIFLDEIGDMSPNLQVKLLRVLQERSFEPVGSSKTRRIDVRIVAATHQNLPGLIEEKLFREDLYYRLNVVPIEVPALRNRGGDVALLVHHFLGIVGQGRDAKNTTISGEAMERLSTYHWPGNVRELENLMERLAILCGADGIQLSDLPDSLSSGPKPLTPTRELPAEGLSLNRAVEELEKSLISQALVRTKWNKNRAAQLLDVNRTTLIEKIKKRELTPPD